ncbi:MAG: type II toxin-antitoxin system HicB family antitoxin [Proteobacteria bacterium]|nr:type II toxin-antitoxin system HicB family antitoxin [Pseudomonadota bacterium]
MTDTYIALLRKEADSDYGVEFPDLPGCVTAGTSLDDAAAMAREALDFHLEGLAAEGQPRPKPSALADILAKAESSGALPVLVPAAKPKGRAARVSVTIEEHLLAEIDAEAGPGGRSGFLAQAARNALGGARALDNVAKTIDETLARQSALVKVLENIPVIVNMKKIDAMLNASDSAFKNIFDQIDAAQERYQHLFDDMEAMRRRMDALLGNKNLTAQAQKLAKRGAAKSRANPARKGRVTA